MFIYIYTYIYLLLFYRSLQPLLKTLLDPESVQSLRENRSILSRDITNLINEYGPKVFQDFDGKKKKG